MPFPMGAKVEYSSIAHCLAGLSTLTSQLSQQSTSTPQGIHGL